MAFTSWSTANYLFRNSQVVNAFPFFISAWVYRTSTAASNRTIVQVGQSGADVRRAQFRFTAANPPDIESACYNGAAFNSAHSSSTAPVNAWFHAAGEFISTTSRASLLNAAGRGTDTNTNDPAASDALRVGLRTNDTNDGFDSADAIAEVSIWGGSMTGANMDSLAAKLYNGGAAGAGGNPININAEAAQPWSGQLIAYWINSANAITDLSGNGKDLTMQGTLTNFASHPTIEAVSGGAVVNTPGLLLRLRRRRTG